MNRHSRCFRALLDRVAADAQSLNVANEALSPLRRYDREQDGDLEFTLRTYFECNGNVSKASEKLFLHRNGLIYRLSRIEGLLGLSLTDPEIRLAVEIALWTVRRQGDP